MSMIHQKRGHLSRGKKAGVAAAVVVVAIALSILAFLLFRRRNRVRMDCGFGIENSKQGVEQSPTAGDGNSRLPVNPSNVPETLEKERALPESAKDSVSPLCEPSNANVHGVPIDEGGLAGVATNPANRKLVGPANAIIVGSEPLPLSTGPFDGAKQSKIAPPPSPASPLPTSTDYGARESGAQPPSYLDAAPLPQTQEQHHEHILDFAAKNLPKFTKLDDPRFAALAEGAVDRANEIVDICGHPELIPDLIKLSLYKFIILCDDSSSMTIDQRLPALKDTLQRVARFATILEPEGISVRFLNYGYDGHFDNLRIVEDIRRIVDAVEPSGLTRLGGMLDSKVVQPMIIEKAVKGNFEKPVIVVIITDGEPTEPEGTLKKTIVDCKAHPAVKPYGDSAVIFLISQVGDSIGATQFLTELENDPEVGKMVFCSKKKLDEQESFLRQWGDREYTAWLIDLFAAALRKQSGAQSTRS